MKIPICDERVCFGDKETLRRDERNVKVNEIIFIETGKRQAASDRNLL
jgi:hypothetical protein